MQIHVDHVEAHVAGPHEPQYGIQVGAIVVEQAAGIVNDLPHVLDGLLEHAEGGRIGQHQAGSVRPHRGCKRHQIDVAFAVGGNLLHRVAAHHGAGRVGAVRGVGHQDFAARTVAARIMVGADHGDAGKLALRARHGRQRHARHAGHVLEHFLQFEQGLQKALPGLGRRMRMPRQKLRQHGDRIARARVVFHGA